MASPVPSMPCHARRRGFVGSDGGVAAVEFAAVFPVLTVLMLFGLQVVTYVRAVRKVELLAASISEMISQATPPSGSTVATVNQLDIHFSFDAGLVVFPYLMQDAARQSLAWWQDITIDYAGIQFTQVSNGCSGSNQSACYLASVVWTSTGTVGSNYRACGVPQLASTGTVPSRTTLPQAVFGPGSLVVIDVVFTFHPSFGNAFLPAIRIARSVYVQPRYASLINYDTTNTDGIAIRCPGY